ncbi:NIF3 family protein [Chlamydia ibidis]|uniref:GTP cyclohydrolase 1 type 2 homolog n=2 Tax=Chlamydia ibidis TaxID=1405396 RepID=S7KIT5_9CHLA|nr:Nif3-like dinuclear metal center hexameric protein [Chlamydia ibidis]EPP34305.1 NIF3 family protein [Chlamydia ibidis]EQM62757.1 NIF3 family protein [Chlamydia ibidis 10-1398/6]
MLIADLLAYLDTLLSPAEFIDYAPNGLQIGKESSPVNKIGVAVSADLATIEAAVQNELDTLIVHHGIFWKNMPYPLTNSLYDRVYCLIKHNIQLLAYHLPLDANTKLGNNWRVACDLKWENCENFGSTFPQLGVKGRFPRMHVRDFISLLSDYYNTPVKAVALGGEEYVSSAALVSGGAYREIVEAAKNKVDCFITGNFDEPAWSMAIENKVNFIAFGHTQTEKIGPMALASHLESSLRIPTMFLDTKNPF